jgi:hypothetical protein
MLSTVALAGNTNCPIYPPNILNSVWAGDITIALTDGTAQDVAATLTILSQTDSFFSGELVLSTLPDSTTIAFSGIIGSNCDRALYMTAQNIIMTAAIKRVRYQQIIRINLRGQNVGDGSTFSGELLLQP